MRREKSLRIGVHHADGVVWGPVYRTRLILARPGELVDPVRRALKKTKYIELFAPSPPSAHLAAPISRRTRRYARARADFPDRRAFDNFAAFVFGVEHHDEVRSTHWSPYDRVGVVNAVP